MQFFFFLYIFLLLDVLNNKRRWRFSEDEQSSPQFN